MEEPDRIMANLSFSQQYQSIRRNPLLSDEQVQKDILAFIRNHKEALSGVSHYDRVDGDGIYTGSRKVHNPKPGGYKFDVPFRGDKIASACRQ